MKVNLSYRIKKVAKNLMKVISLCFPIKNVIIFESLNDFDGSSMAVWKYMQENNLISGYKIVWLVKPCFCFDSEKYPGVSVIRQGNYNLKQLYYLSVAKYELWECFSITKLKKKQKNIWLTHGSPLLKNIHCMTGSIEGKEATKNASIILCPSKNVTKVVAWQYSCSIDKLKICGLPRNDTLYKVGRKKIHNILEQSYNKIIIWLPTFRKGKDCLRNDSSIEYALGIPLIKNHEELMELNQFLKLNKVCFILKLHPHQDTSVIKISSLSNILLLTDDRLKEKGLELYEILNETDAMISDYSSITFDYLLLDKPQAFVVDDINYYTIGFAVENPLELMAGKKLYNLLDLKEFINNIVTGNDSYKKVRKTIREITNDYADGNNAQRVCRLLGMID